MSQIRHERVAPPAPVNGYWVRFLKNKAKNGWEELVRQEPRLLREFWEFLERDPSAIPTDHNHYWLSKSPDLAYVLINGEKLKQWQYKITHAGRIWYCVDEAKKTVYITYAHPKHPKETERGR